MFDTLPDAMQRTRLPRPWAPANEVRTPQGPDVRWVGAGMIVSNSDRMPKVFTIGYEQHRTTESLIAVLQEAGVRRLVDVRELPLSRKRGFSKRQLAAALGQADIEYEHARALGNPKPYRNLYRSGRAAEGERRYRQHLNNGSHNALLELSQRLDAPTCLLCFEASPEDCHRAVIVEALEDELGELDVVHLQ
jgi:uncharacterized protein (DUF488 family)